MPSPMRPFFLITTRFSAVRLLAARCTRSAGEPPGCVGRHSYPWRREGWGHQGTSYRVCKTEIRLEGNAALGHQRKSPDARKRDLFSRTDYVGAVSCTNFDGLCCDPAPSWGHRLAALRAEASS